MTPTTNPTQSAHNPTTANPNRMEPNERKQLLIEATIRCLKKYGFQGTSVRKICAEAGVSVGLINHHYASKDDLIAQTYQQLSDIILQGLAKACQTNQLSPREQLSAFIQQSFTQDFLDPQLIDVWITFWGATRSASAIQSVHDKSYLAYRHLLFQALSGLALEKGWQSFNANLAAISLSALLDGLWLESGLNPHNFTPEQAIQMCEAWVNGLVAGAHQNYCEAWSQ